MLAVSDRFLASIRDAHEVSVAAYVYRPSDPETPIEVAVIGGTVNANADARVLRQASLDIGFTRENPEAVEIVRELPFGGYVSIERGVRFADGTIERVPLGYFRVEAIQWYQLQGMATLTLADRFAQIQDEPFAGPWSPEGMKPSDAIVAVVQQVFGSTIAYHVQTTPSSEPVTTGTTYDQERTEAISDLSQAIAAETLFDPLGDFVLRPRYRPSDPVWTIDAGARGVMIAAQETLDRSSVRNGVSLRGQANVDQPPIYALAVFDDPADPVRWGGPFGRVLLIAESTAVSTQAQADAAAQSLLNLRLGLARTLTLASVPNPALEVGDVIAITFPDGREETQTINETRIDLGPEAALEIVTTSQYRPEVAPLVLRLFYGERADEELARAEVVYG